MCVRGRGAASSIFRRRSLWLKPLHSIHIKAKSEKHIHKMATIFYLNELFHSMTSLNPTNHFYSTHWQQTDSHIKENKGMVAIMLVYVPPTAQAISIPGLYLSFTGGVVFPLHHGGIFALKGSAPSRVYHLTGT